jgi:hypothetical protein
VSGLPEGKAGKGAALALLLLVVATFYFAILSPVLAFYDGNAERLEQRRETVRRYQNAANDLPRLREEAKQRRAQSNRPELLLTGASDAIAAAALQSNLKDIIEGEGAKITSASVLTPDVEDNYRRVGVRIAFSGDLELLTTVLLGIEAAHPALIAGNLDVRVTGNADEETPTLAVAMDVFGYRAR